MPAGEQHVQRLGDEESRDSSKELKIVYLTRVWHAREKGGSGVSTPN
jgi:hypothetical protein